MEDESMLTEPAKTQAEDNTDLPKPEQAAQDSGLPAAKTEPRKKIPLRLQLIQILILTIAGVFNAIAMHAFVIPNGFVSGGISGFAMIFAYLANWNTGIFLAMLNTPLVIISYFFIGKRFAFKTLISVIVSSLSLWLLGILNFPQYIPAVETKLLPAAAGGVISGLSLAIILKCGSSNGGTDVIATIIQKKRADINIAWFILALDMTSILVSVFVFTENGISVEPLILALVFKFVSAKACETVLEGIKSAMKFEIITVHPEEVSREIMNKLHRGVTMIHGTGMYSKEGKALLICVIRRKELSALQRIIKKYPDTFCYISSTSDVMGKF